MSVECLFLFRSCVIKYISNNFKIQILKLVDAAVIKAIGL